MRELLLIVPAFNEEESIGTTIDMLNKGTFDFVVVNDGSKDQTGQIARQKGALVIDLPFNEGLAGAFQAGMQYACTKGYSYAMQFDADGQHLPEYIAPMLAQMKKTGSDILIGSRFLENPIPRSLRTVGGGLIRGMIRLTCGKHIADPTSGMRLFNRQMIQLFASRGDLTPEPDTIAYLMRNGFQVEEYPVTMQERIAGTSYLGSWSAVRYMSCMALSILMIQFARNRIHKEELRL